MAEFHSQKEYDPATGITEEMWYDDRDGKIHVRRTMDIEPVLKANQIQIASSPRDFYRDQGVYHKARIPTVTIEKWMKEEGFNWFTATDAEKRAKLNANKHLHVRKGRL